MNRIKNSLSMKVFLGTAAILLIVCLLLFGFLRLFMPHSYENELAAQMTVNFQRLVEQIESTNPELWEEQLVAFCIENNASSNIEDTDGNSISQVKHAKFNEQNENSELLSFGREILCDGHSYMLSASSRVNAANQLSGIFTKSFPYALGIIFILSVLAALLYSRILAKPIVKISTVSKRMAELDTTWRCEVKRTDEIGVLSTSLNEMAEKLNVTLHELHAANEKLQEDIERERIQDKQRSDLFMSISHELNTPLTILKYDLDGMINNIGRYKDRDTYLQHAFQTTGEMERLIQDILLISQMESATFQLNFTSVDMTALVQKVYDSYIELAKSKSIKINTSYEKDIFIKADTARIENVVSNIISNALLHSPEGKTVNIELKRSGSVGVLTVENTGTQINSEDIGQVFQPFYRTDKSRSRHTGGSGLGLFISKTILELHHYIYALENTEKGVCFTMKFPLK